MSPVRYQPSAVKAVGGRRRVLPVAAEDGRAAELDLAVVGDAHLDARPAAGRPCRGRGRRAACCCRSRSRSRRSPGGPSRRGPPRPAGGPAAGTRRPTGTAGNGRRAACGRCRTGAAAGPSAGAGRSPRSRVERGLAAALGDLALDGAPEQVEDLRDDDHRGHPVVAQGIEDDPRVAAPDVQDVRPDRQRVVQPDRLLEEVRQGQERDDPVVHRRDDPVERLDRRRPRCRGRASRPSGVPVVPEVKTSSNTSVGWRGRASPPAASPSPAGRSHRARRRSRRPSSSGSARAEPRAGPGRRGPCPGSGGARRTPRTTPSIASGDMRRSSGTRIRPARIAPK